MATKKELTVLTSFCITYFSLSSPSSRIRKLLSKFSFFIPIIQHSNSELCNTRPTLDYILNARAIHRMQISFVIPRHWPGNALRQCLMMRSLREFHFHRCHLHAKSVLYLLRKSILWLKVTRIFCKSLSFIGVVPNIGISKVLMMKLGLYKMKEMSSMIQSKLKTTYVVWFKFHNTLLVYY